MKILLTGVTGYIGRHLANSALEKGHSVCAIVRNRAAQSELAKIAVASFVDNGSMTDLMEYFAGNRFDGVIHCASCFRAEHRPEDISELIDSNVRFPTKLLESSVRTGVKWFINTGTFWQHYENRDYSSVNLYAATKQAFESIAAYHWEVFDIGFVTLKLTDTYGPDDNRPKIFTLWKKIAESGESLEMSQGEQLIDTVHVYDVVDAYFRTVELLCGDSARSFKGKSYAVSSGAPIRLRDLADIFARVTGSRLNIEWGKKPYRNREVMVPWNQGQVVPGWRPKISLEEGIASLFSRKTGA